MSGSAANAGAAGPLPALTGGAAADPTATGGAIADPTAAAGAAGQVPGVAAPGGFDPTKLMSQGRWLGPLATIGGGAMALKGFQASAAATATAAATGAAVTGGGSPWLKFGGIAAALGGLALTGIGFKAKGIETGGAAKEQEALAAMQQLQQQYEATMQNLANEATTEITSLQQQLAQVQQSGAGAGQGAADGSGVGVGPGLDTTVVPGNGAATAPIGEGGAQQQGTGTNASAPVGQDPATGQASSTGAPASNAAGIQAVIGKSVQLAAGSSPAGTPVAEAGTYRIEQLAGDANGYATLDEANAAARQTMSTELMGSKFLRWMVVEQGGRYYGAVAKQVAEGQGAEPLAQGAGNVVAWSAMNHVDENGASGWKAYSWSQTGGAQTIDVPYGTSNVFGGSVSGGGPIGSTTGTAPTGTAPTGTVPAGDRIDQAISSVTGTSGPAGAAFDPASQVGRSFSINASSTAEGDLARGGSLQVQRFVESSTGGFGTAEEAATAARAARAAAGGGDQWSRWLTLQGGDGRFYVYQGSIVSKATSELQAAPVHVFGAGFAEYFDGATSSWKAVRDQQAA